MKIIKHGGVQISSTYFQFSKNDLIFWKHIYKHQVYVSFHYFSIFCFLVSDFLPHSVQSILFLQFHLVKKMYQEKRNNPGWNKEYWKGSSNCDSIPFWLSSWFLAIRHFFGFLFVSEPHPRCFPSKTGVKFIRSVGGSWEVSDPTKTFWRGALSFVVWYQTPNTAQIPRESS